MKEKLEKLKKDIDEQLSKVKDARIFRDLEIKYLGRKGELSKILRGLASLSAEEKKTIGKMANDLKLEIAEKFKEARELIQRSAVKKEFADVTLPGEKIERGHLHPITQLQNELEDLFISMGFMILDGPEIESDYYNFEALNIPKFHPARDMMDTFYIDKKNKAGEYDLLMRPHVSPILVRAMQKYGVPIRCVIPGRVFRSEAIDASHEHTFYQMDGLMVGKNISISNMIAVMKELLSGIFKKEVKVRVRPGFFPFVEPGVEIDIQCTICEGKGCPTCKYGGWLEILPGGLVHPNVLKAGGIDPKEYNGFAFDVGVTRLAMMKYGIDDIRLFNSGDLRFLNQF